MNARCIVRSGCLQNCNQSVEGFLLNSISFIKFLIAYRVADLVRVLSSICERQKRQKKRNSKFCLTERINIGLNFSHLVSNSHADSIGSTSRKASREDGLPDSSKTVCCCSLNVREYEIDNCFPTQRSCCSRFEDTTCHVIWLCVRHKVNRIVEHKYFEWFIVFLIAASSIALVSRFFQDNFWIITIKLIFL